ncbi:alpha/beta hydrolase [Roseovarius sp. CAU 1744]|uniref:alpha/beta hydrolase n=1 Tax=Roseovarius sp. CAU 1744 TaxID=3140368 RepID=UPI00325BD002
MAQPDIRPASQKFAMALVRSQTGLRLSRMGAKKGAKQVLDGCVNETVEVPRSNGQGTIRTRVYKPKGDARDLPIVVSFHGGGFATGWPERHHAFYRRLMESRPCIVVAPAYTVSIDAPFPAAHDDCYDTVLWVREHAAKLGGSGDIILAGNSSGGGLALSCALRARDCGDAKIAFVMPLYPMIDDRSSNWPQLDKKLLTWNVTNSVLSWHLYLKDIRARKRYEIPAYAVPARAADLSGLPPLLGFVGNHDIIFAEYQHFVDRLIAAGGTAVFKVFAETFHAMEDSAPNLPRSREINQWVSDSFSAMVDTFCTGGPKPSPASNPASANAAPVRGSVSAV